MNSWITYILILTALTIGLAAQTIPDFDVDSFKENLNWTEINLTEATHPDLTDAIESMINGLGSACYSVVKWFAEISAENPTIPFKLLIYFTFFAIFAPVIILLFKLGIIIFILTREYFQNRKEKKELNKLKTKKDGEE